MFGLHWESLLAEKSSDKTSPGADMGLRGLPF